MTAKQKEALDWLRAEGGVQQAGRRRAAFQALRVAGEVEHVFDRNRLISSVAEWAWTLAPIRSASFVRIRRSP
jgi:hypothetical protein